jgi:hypothetical protein
MNVDPTVEDHVRQVLSTVAAATSVADPPALQVDGPPPRRGWVRVLAPVAIAAATVGVVVAVRVADDHTPVRTTTGSEATTTTSRPVTGADTVLLGDTPFRVPRHVDGFGPAQVWDSASHDWADGGVSYYVSGPIEGVSPGSLSVSVRSDPGLHEALMAHDAPAVLQLLYQRHLGTQFVEAGPWKVLEVDRTQVIPGADVGRADRVYNDWLFAAGHDQVIQVTSDGLDGPEMLTFIAHIEGSVPEPSTSTTVP